MDRGRALDIGTEQVALSSQHQDTLKSRRAYIRNDREVVKYVHWRYIQSLRRSGAGAVVRSTEGVVADGSAPV